MSGTTAAGSAGLRGDEDDAAAAAWARDGRRPVLLVEDDEDDAELIAHAFRRAGLANPLERASDGERARDRLAHQDAPPPALVLLDLKLPRLSGHEVLAWLRAHASEAVRRLPVVVLTSSDREDDVRRAYDLGANSYLVKPVGAASLADMARGLREYWLVLNRPAGAAD